MTDAPTTRWDSFLASRLSIHPLIATAIVTLVPIAFDQLRKGAHYGEGYDEAVTDMQGAGIELEGKVLKAISDAEREALERAARLQGEADGFQAAQAEFTDRLGGIYAQHARDLARVGNHDYTPDEYQWRDTPVPPAIGMRLDTALAAREGGGREGGLPDAGSLAGASGYRPAQSDSPQ